MYKICQKSMIKKWFKFKCLQMDLEKSTFDIKLLVDKLFWKACKVSVLYKRMHCSK